MSEETKKPISRAQDAQENAQAAAQAVGSVEEAANQPLPELVLTSEVADREKVERSSINWNRPRKKARRHRMFRPSWPRIWTAPSPMRSAQPWMRSPGGST